MVSSSLSLCIFRRGCRYDADRVNTFVPKPGMSELFKEVISDLCKKNGSGRQEEKKKIISNITENHNKITKARELLLTDNIDSEDYKLMKKNPKKRS